MNSRNLQQTKLEGSVKFLSKSYDEMSTAQKKMQYTCDTILRKNEILKLCVDTYEQCQKHNILDYRNSTIKT